MNVDLPHILLKIINYVIITKDLLCSKFLTCAVVLTAEPTIIVLDYNCVERILTEMLHFGCLHWHTYCCTYKSSKQHNGWTPKPVSLQGKDSFHVSSPSRLARATFNHNHQQLFTIHSKHMSTLRNLDWYKKATSADARYNLVIVINNREPVVLYLKHFT